MMRVMRFPLLVMAGILFGFLAHPYFVGRANADGGCALLFDGTDDYASVPHSPSLDMSGNAFTVEAWVKPRNLSNVPYGWNPRIVEKLRADDWSQYWLYYGYGGRLVGGFYGPTGYQDCLGGSLPVRQWSHVAVSSTNNTLNVYINGSLSASVATSGAPVSSAGGGPLRIGWYKAWYDYFDGTIDELRIWKVARTQADIDATMHIPLTGGEPGLVGYWRFDEGKGQSIGDLSGNGNDGLLGTGPLADPADPTWVLSDAPITMPPNALVVDNDLHGLMEGSYKVTSLWPLTATLSFNTVAGSLPGEEGPMKIWLSVVHIEESGTVEVFAPDHDDLSPGAILARDGLLSPSAGPTYVGTFQHVGDTATFYVQTTAASYGLTMADFVINAILLALGLPPVGPADVIEAYNDLYELQSVQKAVQIVYDARNGDWWEKQKAAAEATWHLRNLVLNPVERKVVIAIASAVSGRVISDKAFQRILGRVLGHVLTVYNLMIMQRDMAVYAIQSGGEALTVQYRAVYQ